MIQETRKRRAKTEPVGDGPRKGGKAPADFQVRIGEDELGRIFHLREGLDQSELLIWHADHYRDFLQDGVIIAKNEPIAGNLAIYPEFLMGYRY